MNIRSLGALIVLNVVLLAALVVVSWAPQPASAQLGGGGNYLMIAGDTIGRSGQAVYIIDTNRALLMAVRFNAANKRFEPIAGRDLGQDLRGAGPQAR